MNEETEDQEDLKEAKETGEISLDDLLTVITEENLHPEIPTGPDVGAERISPVADGDFKSDLLDRLKDPNYAGEYLLACLEESRELFFHGVRNVFEALDWEVIEVKPKTGEI